MQRALRYFLLLCLFFEASLFLSACAPTKEEPASAYTGKFAPLSPENVADIREQDLLQIPDAGSVGGLGYRRSDGLLLAAYLGDGFLRGWDLSKKTVEFEHDLRLVSSTGLGFDVAGNYIIGPKYSQMRDDDYHYLQEYIGGVGLWQTTSGDLIKCLDSLCNEPPGNQKLQEIGAAIDPMGRKVIIYNDGAFTLDDLSTGQSSINLVNSPDDLLGLDTWEPLGKMIFNRNGERLYIARLRGTVNVLGGFPNLKEITPKIGEDYIPVEAITIDSRNKKLARLQGEKLSIWQLGLFNNRLIYESDVPNGKLLSFDQFGNFLVIGAAEKIQIFDITNQKLIKEIPANDLSSILVSPDNRLLFWGDNEGVIHIWGIPVEATQ